MRSTFSKYIFCISIFLASFPFSYGQTLDEVLSNPYDHPYVSVNSVIFDHAMPLLVKDTDSAFYLIDTLINISQKYNQSNDISELYSLKAETCRLLDRPLDAKNYFLKAIQFSRNDSLGLVKYHAVLSELYLSLGKIDSSLYQIDKCSTLIDKNRDKSYYSNFKNTQGNIAFAQGHFISALDYYQDAENYAEANIAPLNIKIESYNLQAKTYFALRDYDQAISYLEKCIETISSDKNLKLSKCRYELKLATYLIAAERFDPAEKLLREVEICFADRDLPQTKISIHSSLARAFLGKGNLIAAQSNINLAKKYLPKVESFGIRISYFTTLGKVQTALGEYKSAQINLDEALKIAESAGADQHRLSVYGALKDLADKQDLVSQSLFEINRYYKLKDSLFSIQQTNLALDYEARYNRKEQEKSIAELNMINDVQGLKLKSQQKQFFWFALLLAGLIALLYMAYISYNRRKKNEEILSQKNKEISKALDSNELLLKEIHHRVKNNLQVVSSILSLQSRQIEDEGAKKVIKAGQDRIRSMALIHQNLHQSKDLLGVNTKSYLEELIFGLSRTYNIENDKIRVDVNVEDLKLDIDRIIPLGLIANELISNAMKYAFSEGESGSINVQLKNQESHISFSVRDNGKGMPKDFEINQSKSLGFRIVSAFTKKLKGEVSFPLIEKGTLVLIKIPNN